VHGNESKFGSNVIRLNNDHVGPNVIWLNNDHVGPNVIWLVNDHVSPDILWLTRSVQVWYSWPVWFNCDTINQFDSNVIQLNSLSLMWYG